MDAGSRRRTDRLCAVGGRSGSPRVESRRGRVAAGQWYLVVNGAQAGPFTQDDVMARLRAGQIDRATLVFTAGMSQWTPLGQVPELAGAAASGFATPPPPPVSGQKAHEIAYKIVGEDLQFVEVELDPRES